MDNLPAREGEAYERMLRRGKTNGSRREKSGNLREVIHHNLPTPATSEPGFTFQPVDKDGNPTDNPNERWYHPKTGRLVQKGIKQVLDEGLLRTPAASEGERGHQPEKKARARGGQVTLSGQFLELFPTPNTMDSPPVREAVSHNLPTPTASDKNDRQRSENWKGDDLVSTVKADLLPTTQTSMANGPTQKELDAGNPKSRLETVTNWGKFEPAIRRWERTIERPAPSPTKPDGKDGNHRLSSKFTEWMMGLPDGWITDVGLTRNEELKACGNGVVPQQAELALRVLLEGIDLDRGVEQVNLPTPTVSDTFTGNLKSTQQKPGSMHSVTLPQAVRWVSGE